MLIYPIFYRKMERALLIWMPFPHVVTCFAFFLFISFFLSFSLSVSLFHSFFPSLSLSLQTVGVIQLERGSASFTRIIPCRGSDAIFCLHDNGVVSLRARTVAGKEAAPSEETAALNVGKEDNLVEMTYETLCVSGSW